MNKYGSIIISIAIFILLNAFSTAFPTTTKYTYDELNRLIRVENVEESTQTGSLTVSITPGTAVSDGAKWRVDDGAWQNTGDTVPGLSAGEQHRIDFIYVPGWDEPPSQTVTIQNGQTSSASGQYSQQVGSLSVAITPDAVVSSATWRVDGGTWQISGAMVQSLGAGSHYVEFSGVTGWATPDPRWVTIANGYPTNITANYTVPAYSITAMVAGGYGGTITPGSVTLPYGGSQTFTIAAESGFTIGDVVVDDVSRGQITSYTFSNVTSNHIISVSFNYPSNIVRNANTGRTYSSIQAAYSDLLTLTGHTIQCREILLAGNFTAGRDISVTIDGGYTPDFSSNPNMTIIVGALTINSGTVLLQNFLITGDSGYLSLTAYATPGGTISPSSAKVPYGNGESFTITPDTGYYLADISVDGSSVIEDSAVGMTTSYIYRLDNITEDHEISAGFDVATFTITGSVTGSNGTIDPPTAVVNYGESQTFTPIPATGYHIADVLVDGSSVGAVTSYTFDNVTAAGHTIQVRFAINTYTVSASVAGSGGTITPTSATVNYGGSQVFTITAATGYHILDVKLDGSSVGAVSSYTLDNVTADHNVQASFAINTYSLTASVSGTGGTITPTSATVNYGGSQVFTITPATGYHVLDVKLDGSSVGAVPTYTLSNVAADHSVQASFAINTYSLTASVSGTGGTITPTSATVNYGGSQVFTITPATGYHVLDVKVDGSSVGAVSSYTLNNVTAAHNIQASFAINTYTVQTSVEGGTGGTITPTSPTVNYGGSQVFTITPSTGYHILDVKVDGSSVGPVSSYTLSNVTAAHTILARFSINTFSITASVPGGNGTITPTSAEVSYGGSQAFTITPNQGYGVADVLVDGVSQGALATLYIYECYEQSHPVGEFQLPPRKEQPNRRKVSDTPGRI